MLEDNATYDATDLPQDPPETGVQGADLPSTPELEQDRNKVLDYLKKIRRAKIKWKPDFDRMRKNMEFVGGLQWPGQTTMDDSRYIVNLILRLISQKVSTLYAKNPTVEISRQNRRDFQVWDENPQTIMEATQQAAQFLMSGQALPPELEMLFEDIQQGMGRRQQIEAICDTLNKFWAITMERQKPEYKQQLKQSLVRACVCGVAHIRPLICHPEYSQPSSVNVDVGLQQRAQALLQKTEENGDVNDKAYTDIRSITQSLGAGLEADNNEPVRLEFDFPPATSIIPDERCRQLVGFVGARWIAQEYILPVEEVNALFGVDIKIGPMDAGDRKVTNAFASDMELVDDFTEAGQLFETRQVRVYEVFDYTTKTRCFVCSGWADFLMPPTPPAYPVSGFWEHFPIVLNAVEVEAGCRTSIFPPSDVQTVKDAQMEWNRTREALRDHRNANAPKYIVRKGALTENDKNALTFAKPNTVIELEGIPPDKEIEQFIMPFQFTGIDTNLYDVSPLEQDIYMAGGMQQANLGPAQSNVTATVGSIAEQSRLSASASNIDDLDDWQSSFVQAATEMTIQSHTQEDMAMLVGPGAVLPQDPLTRAGILKEILIKVKAASSGRPNMAIDIQNWRQLAPLMFQAGANPVGLIAETARRLGDDMDVHQFFPLMPPTPQGPPGGSPPAPNEGGQSANPQEGQPPLAGQTMNGSPAQEAQTMGGS